jgi:hypothetical protein
VLINIGAAEENLLHYNEAVRAFERYLSEGGAAVPADRRARVQGELEHIHGIVAEVSARVSGAAATIEVDGRVVGISPLEGPILLAAGAHRLRATRPGDQPAERTLDVRAGERQEIDLSPAAAPKVVTTAELTVRAAPARARIALEGQAVGEGGWSKVLPAGTYELQGSLDGYAPANARIHLVAGEPQSVTLELRALPPPWYKRWYVWAGVAALATAVAVPVAIVSTQPSYGSEFHWPPP